MCVTFNAASVVSSMLDSLEEADRERPEVVVVDNGSVDGTAALVRGRGDATVIEQTNTGYADGVNRGVRHASSNHDTLVLNPDVVLDAGAIARLRDAIAADATLGIAAPTLLDPTGVVLPSLRREPRSWRTLIEAVVGGSRAGRCGEAFSPDRSQDVVHADWMTGAAMLIRREVIEQLGPFDTSFFLYSEETEYCLRVRDAGWALACVTAASGMHVGGEMDRNPQLWALRAVNRVRLQARRRGRAHGVRFRLASLAFELRRAAGGNAVSRHAVRSLLSRDLDAEAIRLASSLGADTTPMQ